MKTGRTRKNLQLPSFCYAVLVFAVSCSCEKGGNMSIILESAAFAQNQAIPSKYTCTGADVSPPLSWKNIPETAKSLVLICDDPDAPAGTWVHWVCYDIPPAVHALSEGIPKDDTLPTGGKQGITDFGRIGYGGPCPPSGTHRYFFKMYALDIVLGLPAGKPKKDVERAMKGHVLAQGQLIGTYSKK
jgi:Raf kinase inhibitor-like YbhB/YbcL family protein